MMNLSRDSILSVYTLSMESCEPLAPAFAQEAAEYQRSASDTTRDV